MSGSVWWWFFYFKWSCLCAEVMMLVLPWSQVICFSSLLVRLAYSSLLLPFSSTTAKPKFPWGPRSPQLLASLIQKELLPEYLDASVREAKQPRACRSSGISDFRKTHPLDTANEQTLEVWDHWYSGTLTGPPSLNQGKMPADLQIPPGETRSAPAVFSMP